MLALEIDQYVATITMDRPAKKNAFSLDGWAGLARCVDAVASSRARVLIIRSAVPDIFTAGSDLADMAAFHEDLPGCETFLGQMRAAFECLAGLSIPTIAAVDAGCYGAGVALILACDVTIAGAGARFAITPAKLGLIYPRGDVARLVATVGAAQAVRLLASGIAIDAEEAVRCGLAQQLAGDAGAAALALASAMADNAPTSVQALKAMVRRPGDFTLEVLDRCFVARLATDTFAEGVSAFRERRKPQFDEDVAGLPRTTDR